MVREGRVGERGQGETILDLGADTSVPLLDFAGRSEVEDASFKAIFE